MQAYYIFVDRYHCLNSNVNKGQHVAYLFKLFNRYKLRYWIIAAAPPWMATGYTPYGQPKSF